jgi:hypothetical protein
MIALFKRLIKAILMILGLSEEERELKAKFKQTVQQKKAEAMSIEDAKANLEQARRDLHARVIKIRGRLASQHDAEDRRSSTGIGTGIKKPSRS